MKLREKFRLLYWFVFQDGIEITQERIKALEIRSNHIKSNMIKEFKLSSKSVIALWPRLNNLEKVCLIDHKKRLEALEEISLDFKY